MKIAFVLGSLDIGGTESQGCRLASELSRSGNSVTVLVLGNSGPLAEKLTANAVDFEVFEYAGARVEEIPRLLAFCRALRKVRPDVCHAFLYWSYVIALPTAASTRTRVRVSGRRGLTRPYRPRSVRARLERWSNRFAHVIVANSDAVARDVVHSEGVDASRVHVIPNGVDLPPGRAHVERQPAVGLMVANLIAYKGHADVVSALSLLADPPVIRMVGVGPELADIKRLIQLEGLGSVAVLEGSVPGAARLFQEVQFGVLASHEEGFPNAVLEAMAAGVPVIATTVGGIPELIEHGVNGLLVPPRNPAALADAIHRVAGDPALRRRLGDAARKRAADYRWERCAQAHLHLYEKLLTREH